MRRADLAIPEIAVIAATRGLLGAGIGLLLAPRMDEGVRKTLGWTLLTIGALSTVPLAIDVLGKSRRNGREAAVENRGREAEG